MNRARIDLRMARTPEEKYIMNEDMEHGWLKSEMDYICKEWKKGTHISVIAKDIDRDPDEVAFFIVDRVRRGKLKPRKGGALGRELR